MTAGLLLVVLLGGAVAGEEDEPAGSAMPASATELGPPAPTEAWHEPSGAFYVYLPPGEFDMGCVPGDASCAPEETPSRRVVLAEGYWLAATETTVEQFTRFVAATGHRTTAEREGSGRIFVAGAWRDVRGASWARPGFGQTSDHPVVLVSWEDAAAFCAWAGGRLPTEAEWERAARGGLAGSRHSWGESSLPVVEGVAQANVADESALRRHPDWTVFSGYDDGYAETSPVGRFPANVFGLHDLAGNAWEWTADVFDPAALARERGGRSPAAGARRVLKGGSWSSSPRHLRVSIRFRAAPTARLDNLGFRCAR